MCRLSSILYPSTVRNLDEQAYRREPALSQSALRNYLMSPTPWHFKKQHLSGQKPTMVNSQPMVLGSITHARLELKTVEEFERRYVKMPLRMRKIGAPAEAYKAENKGKILVSASDWDLSFELYKAVKRNKTAHSLLTSGIAEESFFFMHNNQKVKGRIDLRVPKHSLIIDWKTCISADPQSYHGFAKSIRLSHLDCQAAFYKSQADSFFPDHSHDFVFVAIEKTYPFACSLITLSPIDMDRAHDKVFSALDEVTDMINKNSWGTGYGDKIWTINLEDKFEK